MKIQWAWRVSVFAVRALVALQTESRGQMVYGQPYAAGPQMVYNPAGAPLMYGPVPAAPYALPAAYYNGDPQGLEPVGPQAMDPASESSAADCETCDNSGSEYFFEGGHRGGCGSHLAGVLAWLAPYSETGCCAPHWFDVHAEAVFMRRDEDSTFQEFTRIGPVGPAVITSEDLQFDTLDPSLRITGVYQTGPGSNLEFTYFGLNEYSEEASATSADDLLYAAFNDFGAQGEIEQVHQAQFQNVQLDSRFYSLELNFRRRWVGPTCLVQGSWVFGVRYFELKDELLFSSVADRDEVDPPGEETGGTALYDLETRNYMTGAQVGGDAWVCLLPGLRAGVDAKAGVYGNNVKVNTVMQGQDIEDNYIGFIGPEALGNDKVSFIGELQLMATYQIGHNLTLRGGYELMFVEGVALAMDNFNPTITGRVPMMSDGGSLLYDGFTFGAEYMW